jgi:alkylhydroperoxidase family enzyme
MTISPTAAVPDWASATGVTAPWAAIWPAPTASFTDATSLVWQAVDPAVADLCRCRIAMLLGDPSPAPRPGMGPEHDTRVANLAQWPTSPLFDKEARACLAFTEQFVMDVGSMTPALVGPVNDALGAKTAAFVQALYLLDAGARLDIVLPRLFGAPPSAATGAGDTVGSAVDPSIDLWPAIEAMLSTVARMGELDPVTGELVRLRGARFHRCRICQSRLSLAALEAVGDRSVLDQVDTYETSDLTEAQKVALRLTDAMVTQPAADLDDALVSAVRTHFTPAQAIEVVYDVARNATNKFAVALGIDTAVVTDGFELFDIADSGEVVAAVDADQLRALLSASSA